MQPHSSSGAATLRECTVRPGISPCVELEYTGDQSAYVLGFDTTYKIHDPFNKLACNGTAQVLPAVLEDSLCTAVVNAVLPKIRDGYRTADKYKIQRGLAEVYSRWFAEQEVSLRGDRLVLNTKSYRQIEPNDLPALPIHINTMNSGRYYKKLVHANTALHAYSAHGLNSNHVCSFRISAAEPAHGPFSHGTIPDSKGEIHTTLSSRPKKILTISS